jgi:hypothetical protein
LTTGYACNCNEKEITILFCEQIGESPNTSYAKCRMGLRERKRKWRGTALVPALFLCLKLPVAGGRPDKITIRQGWGTLVVSARTQKSRFEDLEWSSVTVVSS